MVGRAGLLNRAPSRGCGFKSHAFRLVCRITAPMVKRTSCLASNEVFRVRLLVGVLSETVIYGVCGVAVAARLAVNQKVPVRLPPDTPWRL